MRVHARQDGRKLCVNAERVVAHLDSRAARKIYYNDILIAIVRTAYVPDATLKRNTPAEAV